MKAILSGILVLLMSSPAWSQAEDIIVVLDDCKTEGRENCIEILNSILESLDESLPDTSFYETMIDVTAGLNNSGHFDLAANCARRALDLSIHLRDKKMEARASARLSAVYLYEGQLDSAQIYIERARDLYKFLGDSVRVAVSIVNLGQIQKELGIYESSMVSYLEGLRILEQYDEPKFTAHTINEIATLYAMTEEVDKAISFGRKAVELSRLNGESYYEAYAKLNLANNLIYISREDTALEMLEEVIPVFQETKDIYMEMNAEAQYGRALFRLGKPEEALEHFNRSNNLDPKENFVAQLAYNHEYMSRILRETGHPEKALYHSRKSYEIHQVLGWNEEYKEALRDLAVTYEANQQPDSALRYYKSFMEISDSLYSIRKAAQLNELKSRYETDLKEQEIKAHEAEIVLLQDKNRNKSQRNTALIVAILAISGLAISIIVQQRRNFRLSRKLAEENERSLHAELEAKKQQQQRLKVELDYKKRNLASQALLIAEKNELIRSFKEELSDLPGEESEKGNLNAIVQRMERAENQSRDWDKFMRIFEEVHPDFHRKVRLLYPELSANDHRLITLMKMNFSNKEIAHILHISEAGLKKARYRLRKKMALEPESDVAEHIHKIQVR